MIPKGSSRKLATPGQFRAARALLNVSQVELAKMAGISVPTIKRSESDNPMTPVVAEGMLEKIQAALESVGIEFLDGDEPGVRLKRKSRRR
jgi:transcriptional regulator with XRE-family HTH domain